MSQSKRTSGACAVVTGAGSGIGRAFAMELAARGGRVVCADVDESAAKLVAAEIATGGGQALPVRCDVSRLEDVEALAARASAWFGRAPTLLVNNAGVIAAGKPIDAIAMEDWRWVIDVNLWGVIHGVRAFVPRMREAREGAVLNVASAASFGAGPWMGAYNVTKAGVVSLSETLYAELAGTGVHVSVLCPTFVKTNIVRNSRLSQKQEQAVQGIMDRAGTPPEVLVRRALDGLDRGEIHLLPQIDARLSWRLKRLAPGAFTRWVGLSSRWLPKSTLG